MILFRRFTFYLCLAGVGLAVHLILKLNAQTPPPEPPHAPPARPYRSSVAASGLVEAHGENTAVGAPVPGLVAEVFVKVWDRVQAGEALWRMDDRELQAQLVYQSAAIGLAEAQYQRVRSQFALLDAVTDPRAISRQELELRRDDVLVAEAQIESARAAVASTRLLLERMTVRAPRKGTILQVNLRAGEFLAAASGQATGATVKAPVLLGDLDTLQVRADVDEYTAPRVRPGMPGMGFIKGASETPIPLEFVRIEPYMVPKASLTGASIERVDTRVLQVIYRFSAHPDRPVYPGQQMDIYLQEENQLSRTDHR